MPTVREYEAAMERNAADTEAFVALRKAYRQAQKHDRLVTLYEARAQAIEDNAKAGELFYLAAELRIDQLGDAEGAEADLVNAVDRDPSHIRAAARLKDIYREQGRTADYMTMLEMEAAAVARTRDPARIAELEAEMSQLFLNHFARLERAVRNPQRPGKLAQEHVRSIESARKIYRALGDYRAVVRLYELELEGTQRRPPAGRPAAGAGARAGREARGAGRGGAAAARRSSGCDRATRRRWSCWPASTPTRTGSAPTASIARPPSTSSSRGGGRRRATSRTPSRRCAGRWRRCPGHAESSELLERVYYDARRFQELDRFYRERVAGARPPRPSGSTSSTSGPSCPRASWTTSRRRSASTTRSRCWSRRAGPRPRSWSSCTWTARSTRSWPSCASASWARSRIRSSGRAIDAGAGGAVPRPAGRSRPGGRLPARGAGDRAREPDGAGRLRRALPREGRLGGAGRSAGVLVRARAAGGHRRRGAAAAPRGDRHRQREAAGRRRARASRPGSAPRRSRRRYSRAREAQRRLLLKAQELGPAWRRCSSARPPRSPIPAQRAEILRRAAQIHREKLGKRRARHRDLQGDPARPTRTTRCRCARSSRSTSARATSSAWRNAAARADRARRHEAGARRPAAPGAGDLRRADRRSGAGPVGGRPRSCRRCPAIATR